MPKQKKTIADKTKDLAGLISAVLVIGGAFAGVGQWIVHEVNASTNSRMDSIEQKIDDNQKKNELAITRLELMNLIQNNPTNKVEIEKLGRYYFLTLGGDTYASSVYSDWCEKYGGDVSIVVK